MKDNIVVIGSKEYWLAVNVYKYVEKASRRIELAKEKETQCNFFDFAQIEEHLTAIRNLLDLDPVVEKAIGEIQKEHEDFVRANLAKDENTPKRTFGIKKKEIED